VLFNFKLDQELVEDRGWNRLGNRSRDWLWHWSQESAGESVPAPALDPVQVWVAESSVPVVALATVAGGGSGRDWVLEQESG